jgi:dTDP-4-dehydrorhamnose 3,5-epimerase
LRTDGAEQYFSVSAPGVLRGLHFQLPPLDHAKLVYCFAGRVSDVALELRVGSPSYGQTVKLELSAERGNMIYLPTGLAHGFCTLDEPAAFDSPFVYQTAHRAGITG